MDERYSIPRRIWRILYPPLIFIAVQLFTVGAAGFVIIVLFLTNGSLGFEHMMEMDAIIEEAVKLVNEQSLLILLFSNLINIVVFLPVWMKTRKRIEPRANTRPGAIVMLTIGLFATFNTVQMILFSLVDVMKFFPSYEEVSEVFETGSFAIQLLAIGVCAPIVEELVFRAILINRMKWLPIWGAVLIQGVLFGLVHLNVFQGLYAFVAALLLGLIYIKFHSVIIVIIGHMAYNLTSLILAELASEEAMGIAIMASIVMLPICAILAAKHKKAQSLNYHT